MATPPAQPLELAASPERRSLRRHVYDILHVQPNDHGFQRAFNFGLLALIILNVLAVIFETVEAFNAQYRVGLEAFEVFSVSVFAVEYLSRLWSCTVEPEYRHPLWGRVRFALSFMALVDLVSILPSLIPGGTLDLRFIRSLRLARLARTLKVTRHSQSLQTLGRVLRAKRSDLAVTAIAGLVLLVCAASLMFYAEHESQPQQFSSIPASMWWGAMTLTTVGYGDIYPVTPLGKMLGTFIALMGVGLFALPAGILASGFAEELQRRREARKCPHCGVELP
jgi:voltage-gated potassium channel